MSYHRQALAWIAAEHDYQVTKWEEAMDDGMTAEEWRAQIDMYLHRATVLGIDTPVGRQAAGKAAATAVSYLESLLRCYGVPTPGFPSGEVTEWASAEEARAEWNLRTFPGPSPLPQEEVADGDADPA